MKYSSMIQSSSQGKIRNIDGPSHVDLDSATDNSVNCEAYNKSRYHIELFVIRDPTKSCFSLLRIYLIIQNLNNHCKINMFFFSESNI